MSLPLATQAPPSAAVPPVPPVPSGPSGPPIPLVDHHVHGVVTTDLDDAGFELLISESGVAAPAGTSHFDAPVGLAVRRWCAPVLGLEPHASPADYLEGRRALGAAEVNRRLLAGAGLELLFVETGHRSDEVASPSEMGALSGAPAFEVVRIEAVAERLATETDGPRAWLGRLGEALTAAAEGAVGLKTIVAYRHGLDLPVERPDRAAVVGALDEWFRAKDRARGTSGTPGTPPRLCAPALLAEVLHHGIELAGSTGLPLQVHAGFGDTDLQLDRADPARFTPWVRRAGTLGATVVFLHCYPYHRQAGYLAEVFPHVYFDVGCILGYAGASAPRVLAEAMELAPFTKMLYSSDAFGLAELAYLGALRFRQSLAQALESVVAAGECGRADTERIAGLIGAHNARRIYPVARARVGGPGAAAPAGEPRRNDDDSDDSKEA